MKFQFEKLGALDKQTEIDTGDLTLLCGANNTGKTYTSYAISGFLLTWKNHIQFKIEPAQIENLFNNGVLKLELSSFEKQIPLVLDELSKQYTQTLSGIFSANEDFFSQTGFRALSTDYQPNSQTELQLAIGTKATKILTALKEKDSKVLEITLLIADEDHIPHTTVVKDSLLPSR
ncbi:MAG TPA: hypothetical protein ENG03_05820 [Thioploca sp.]|nr:MAG: hypothetical protein B6247_24405 [Beggiatoa sp. 4572_84]RKZ55460.1 MAG: hypothetical protein DRR08_24320 [Gammaproteobacteria bacterium]HDN26602.1 hypothetical protein [Thioploca sp.]